MDKFFLEHEKAFDQGHSVTLLNTHEAGTILITNFRLLFVSKATQCVVELGTIPLTAIEELNDVPSEDLKRQSLQEQNMLKVTGHDTRLLVFVFESGNKDLKKIISDWKKCIKPVHLRHIYAFSSKPIAKPNLATRIHKEYHRLFHKWFAQSPSTRFDAQIHLENKWWRVSEVNSNYELCRTYPTQLIVPISISDVDLFESATYWIRGRLPVISWFDSGTGAVLARSSQPKLQHLRKMDKLVCALRTPRIHHIESERKLYIIDVRPVASAYLNMSKGGGTELCVDPHTEICHSGIGNIHVMTTAFDAFREYVNGHGSISSDGVPLHQRDPILSTLKDGRNPKSVKDISKLQTWLGHIQNILASASYITAKITGESASVLVHCSDGWDRTSQLVGLSCLLLDPFYRTFDGFQALVEKDWLAFGHQFAARMGLPTVMIEQKRPNYEVPWRADGSIQSGESSPIFLQWIECIAHLLCIYPFAFEFSSKFLVDFIDAIFSCRFGNFLCNSEQEREQVDVASCLCIWKYLADLRASNTLHEHRNPLYDPQRHNGPIVPPPPALAPTLWSQFYLRWSCPLESRGGVGGFQEFVKAKMAAQPVREPKRFPEDEVHPVAKGRLIHHVGSNAKKF